MRILVVAALAIGLAMPAWGQDLDAGLAAYNRGDYAAALKGLLPLAEQGYANAQVVLAVMYNNGRGVPLDHAQAVVWYRRAAEQGNTAAQSNLGFMYRIGQGVPQDYAAALQWFRRAAEQGEADAQSSLGAMYGNGDGAPQDYVEAHKWFNLAASRGNDSAGKNRDIAAERLTPEQVAEAQRLAREWQPKAE